MRGTVFRTSEHSQEEGKAGNLAPIQKQHGHITATRKKGGEHMTVEALKGRVLWAIAVLNSVHSTEYGQPAISEASENDLMRKIDFSWDDMTDEQAEAYFKLYQEKEGGKT